MLILLSATHGHTTSLASSRRSSLSPSARSLPAVKQSVIGEGHSSFPSEPVEPFTGATVPPTSSNSSVSELPEDIKGSSPSSDQKVCYVNPLETQASQSSGVKTFPQADQLPSILGRDEVRFSSLQFEATSVQTDLSKKDQQDVDSSADYLKGETDNKAFIVRSQLMKSAHESSTSHKSTVSKSSKERAK